MKLQKIAELSFWTTYYFIASCLACGVLVSLSLLILSLVEQHGLDAQIESLSSFIILSTMLAYMVAQKLPKRRWLNLLFLCAMPILMAYSFYDLYTNPTNLFSLEALGFDLLVLITTHLYWNAYDTNAVLLSKTSV
ncbi:hypothetical protein L6270_01395 [Candidatus Parcubacteria bacterium]|nr:hypothetical protein [Patescibacteria group bacterium]MBU4309795.1 hypothetical protein [Patescibacteria group bacterium]MBU4431801.1 hypothetical protein [Patescibacteria group bacterium]MBU4578134.1 hypothetical protein [Patescibacteria group bacterium]MCG2696671.1 hypothetical protein [Candidatus Parcubacteria bacterium]